MFNTGSNTPFTMPVIPAVSGYGNNGGGYGDGAWWVIVLFALIFGWGNGDGFGPFGGGGNKNGSSGGGAGYLAGLATQADIQRGFDTSNIVGKLDGITNGLCDGFYNVNTTLMNGFHGVDNAICNLGYQTQQGFNTTNIAMMQAQNALQALISQCCCENREGQAQIRYDMATNTCALQNTMNSNTRDIIDNQNAGTRAILDYLCQDKISTLQAENQTLRFQASQTAQNQFITQVGSDIVNRLNPPAIPAYSVPNPNVAYFGCNAGCGC